VTWLPFDLHPEYPPEGIPRTRLHARYGDAFHDRLRGWFEREELTYAPPPDVVPNTMLAQRLTELARERGLHQEIHDRLMDAYWEQGADLTSHDELRRLLPDLPDVDRVLSSDEYRDRVHASTAQAQSIGINGIPGFLLDRRLLLLGAQPLDVFRQAFAQLAA